MHDTCVSLLGYDEVFKESLKTSFSKTEIAR